MLLTFVRHPRFEPATTRLSGKIHTHFTTAPATWFRGSFYGIYNGNAMATNDQVTRLEACFVDIQCFSCIFCIKMAMTFSQFGRTEENKTRGYASSCYKLFTILFVTPKRSVRANYILKSTLEIEIFLELMYKLLTGPLQKCKCFSEISR